MLRRFSNDLFCTKEMLNFAHRILTNLMLISSILPAILKYEIKIKNRISDVYFEEIGQNIQI